MTYTVKQLAKLSGISVRTLHWYDEKGLLKPAFIGENGYRYYEQEQLLLLQQILFFKELDFSLNDIQNLLDAENFDKVKTLQTHRQVLEQEIDRKHQLLLTIDKTIAHLQGQTEMKNEELYKGFDLAKQAEYEQYLVKYRGTEAEKLIKESHKRTAKWDKDEWDDVKSQGDAIHKALAAAIDAGLSPDCDEVQAIITKHYALQNRFYDVIKSIYLGLTELYAEHPDFRKHFESYHPELIKFISKAIDFYAQNKL